MTTTARAADVRLVEVWDFPDALLGPLARAGVRTVGGLAAAADGLMASGRTRARTRRAAMALVAWDAVLYRADLLPAVRAAVAAASAAAGEGTR